MDDRRPSDERAQFQLLLETAAKAMVKVIMENGAHIRYVEDSEISVLLEGIRNGFLHVDGNVVRLQGYDKRPYDLFTLNRELLTQLHFPTSFLG